MSPSRINRIKKRLLKEAVTDNVDTIRGLPPRAVRGRRRWLHAWMRRVPVLIIITALAGSTWVASSPTPVRDTIAPARIIVRRPARAATAELGTIDPTPVSTAAFPLTVRRVVIDAGHGGADPGTTSPMRFTEKEVTLDIAARLGAMLRAKGFEVINTRQNDQLVALRDRARIANDSESDIFLSIHVNAIEKYTEEHGVETYYLGPTNDPSLTRLAADENRMSGYSVADMRRLLDRIYADARRDESLRLASAVQERLYDRLRASDGGLRNWGVKRAPFIVLVATDMPAILAEVGCMSNPREVTMLQRPDYRQRIAEALYEGIHAYASAADAPQKKGT